MAILLRRHRGLGIDLQMVALFGLLIASLPIWFPPAQEVSIRYWSVGLLCLTGATALGLLLATFQFLKKNSAYLRAHQARLRVKLVFLLPWIILACGYISVLLTRPILEWDAVTYYLPTAQNYVVMDHFSHSFSHLFSIGAQAPAESPPLVPWLYALAIEVGQIFHQPADQAVRLMPFLFLLIFWLATHRLASALLSRKYAKYASLLIASLPLLILNVVVQPFYLDIPITACFTAVVATSMREQQSIKPLAIGAWAFLAVLAKITGLPLIMVLTFCYFLYKIGGTTARILMLTSVVAVVLVAVKFRLLLNFQWPIQWLVLIFFTLVLWHCLPKTQRELTISARTSFLALLAFSPAILYLINGVRASGGLSQFYLLPASHSAYPNWDWAHSIIEQSQLLDTYVPAEVRSHIGIGLLLWWGFNPVVMLFAFMGGLLAMRKRSNLRLLVALGSMLIIVWLTVFHSRDYRHILTILPFEAILALYAVKNIFVGFRPTANFVVASFFLLSMPLAWIAQQNYYAAPIGNSAFNQDLAWEKMTLFFSLLLSGVLSLLLILLRVKKRPKTAVQRDGYMNNIWFALLGTTIAIFAVWLCQRGFLGPLSLMMALTAVTGAAAAETIFKRSGRRTAWTLCLVCITLIFSFEPVIATGGSGKFLRNREAISNRHFIGYLGALRKVQEKGASGILGFLTYGVSWFSEARVRPIDLLNPLDLATLRNTMSSGDVTELVSTMKSLGVMHAIFPAIGTNFYYRGFYDFLNVAGLKSVQGLHDPLFSTAEFSGGWNVLTIEPNSGPAIRCSTALQIAGFKSAPRSLEHSNGLTLKIARPFIQIVLQKCKQSVRNATMTILYNTVNNETTGLWQKYSTNEEFRSNSAQHTLSVLVARLGSRSHSANTLIKSIGLTVTNKLGEVSYINWRSPHFTVTSDVSSNDSNVGGDVFVSRPEHALISYVSLQNKNGSGLNELTLYPRPLSTFGELNGTLPLYGKIVTRKSFDCTAHAPISVNLKATVSVSNKTVSVQKSIQSEVGATVLVNINGWLDEIARKHSEVQWITFSEISVRGLGNNSSRVASYCSAEERLGAPHVTLVRTDSMPNGFIFQTALSFLPGTQALVINDVR